MKKIITFTKSKDFKTQIAEITNIEVNHDLELNENYELKGNIQVSGKYKMTEASVIEEDFSYNLPCVIAIDCKYDTTNLEVNVSDFNFEIVNEESLNLTIDIELDGLEEIRHDEIPIPVEIEEISQKLEYEEPIEKLNKEVIKDSDNYQQELEEKEDISSIFANLPIDEETFSTYHVYIVRDGDTIDKILEKYKINREQRWDFISIKIINKLFHF